ncbi:MAG TPA: tRNA pseudouridine(38-40) synthase TruA [Thermoanaerobaculia bacterium]|nr:tRNA pseudouridine(38-40) synthase TruA [Thermoanaerobaculia bacterium]
MRQLFTLQYLGTRYAGWQLQANALSVQQVVEEALEKLFHAPVRVHGAGRTDAGVHALAQRAHADVPFEIPPRGLILGINQLLPPDVRVTGVENVADEFHARFEAKAKTYEYRIWNAEVADVFAQETHAHVAQKLDAAVMHEAAQALVGTHDFAAFTVAEPEVESTVRTIESISVARDANAVVLTVTADGFLRYMVRRIAGSLIETGRGRMEPKAMFEEARWTAPAKGLVLREIRY